MWSTSQIAALLLLALSDASASALAQDSVMPKGKRFWISAATVFTSALVADEPLRRFANSHRSVTLDRIAADVDPLGRARYLVSALAAGAVLPRLVRRDSLANAALHVALGYAAADVAGGIMRVIAARHRPDSTGDPWRFRPFRPQGEWGSTPSAHATHAFAIAAGVAELSHDRRVAIACYTLATLVAMQRVYTQAHWTSDVIAASAVATSVSRAAVHLGF
jgi:membrane-associated phospholipid phosphatase